MKYEVVSGAHRTQAEIFGGINHNITRKNTVFTEKLKCYAHFDLVLPSKQFSTLPKGKNTKYSKKIAPTYFFLEMKLCDRNCESEKL